MEFNREKLAQQKTTFVVGTSAGNRDFPQLTNAANDAELIRWILGDNDEGKIRAYQRYEIKPGTVTKI